MTLLGKMLVFIVLVLALIWNALVVNAYATRTNWKAQADKAQKSAQDAAASAGNLRKLVEVEREASEERTRTLRDDNTRLYDQNVTLKKNNDDLNKAYQDQQTTNRGANAKADQLQANVNTLQKQIDVLTLSIAENQKQIDKLTHESEASKAAMVEAQLKAEAQQRRAEQLNELVQQFRGQIQERQTPGGGGNPLERRPAAPTAFRGTVRARDGNLISFTPGLDAGLQNGTVLTIQRLSGGKGKYVGKLKVTLVDPKEGVGQFVPPSGMRLVNLADWPQAGDELVPE
jgi:hypothetical protein